MKNDDGRIANLILVVVPVVIGVAIGLTFGQQITAGNPLDCAEIPQAGTLSTAFTLGGIVVVLLIGTIIAMFVAGPALSRALFLTAIAIVLTSCSTLVFAAPTTSCVSSAAVSGHARQELIGFSMASRLSRIPRNAFHGPTSLS